jgi:Phage late-transcription coactivator
MRRKSLVQVQLPQPLLKEIVMPPAKKEEMLKFQEAIQNIVKTQDISYIEAIVEFCEVNDFDIETVPRFLSQNIRDEIQREAEDLSLLKEKSNRLPI